MITIYITNADGIEDKLDIPIDVNLSLMEVLRAGGYPALGACGGIALCATCAVEVLSGAQNLSPAGDQELDMLDLLPGSPVVTRLACQIRLGPEMNGMLIRLLRPD